MLTVNQFLQNRYRIDGPLGHQGGMSAVYKALDTRVQRPCVVKELTLHQGMQQQGAAAVIAQFQQEAMTLANLNHPNIPRVTDYFLEAGNYYLVMDFVAGTSLEDMIGRGMAERTALIYTDQLLDVLAYLHHQSILHRDIKPANVIVRTDNRAVLVDFGLSKPAGLATGSFVRGWGTEEYAPPEQISGGTDPRSDLYSLGATLYHVLTGRPPASAAQRMAGYPLIPLRQIRPDLSALTEAAVLRAMELNRLSRFQSAVELRMALRPMAASPTVLVAPPAQAPGWPVPPSPVVPSAPAPANAAPPAVARSTWNRVVLAIAALVGAVVICGAGGALALCRGVQCLMPVAITLPAEPAPAEPAPAEPAPAEPAPAEPVTAEPVTAEAVTAEAVTAEAVTAEPVTAEQPPVTPSATVLSARLGRSAGGRDIMMTQVGYPNGRGPIVVVVGLIAGEQWDTVGVVNELIQAYQSRPADVPNEAMLYLIPSINPDGGGSKRLNDNGVDLNRNWDTYNWSSTAPVAGVPTPGAGGSRPFSEPETQALQKLLLDSRGQGRGVRVILLHSSARANKREVYPGYTQTGTERVSGELARRAADVLGFVYADQGSDPTTGEAITWCADQGIPSIDLFWSRPSLIPAVGRMISVIEVVSR